MISPNPLSSYVGALTPSITIFVVRKYLWLNEIIRVGPWSERVSVIMRRDMKSSLALGPCAHREGRPHEDLVRRWLPASGEGKPTRDWALWDLDPGLATLQSLEKISVCFLRHPVCSTLLSKTGTWSCVRLEYGICHPVYLIH